MLLRPLPYHDPDRLVVLLYGRPGRLTPWFSPLNYHDIIRGAASFHDAAAFAPSTANLTGNGEPERVEGASVSWNYFNVLGVTMRGGRRFVEADGSGDTGAVVIADRLWRRRFGGRPDAIGSTIHLDGRARTVVGIAPAEWQTPQGAEFWKPLVFLRARRVAELPRGAMDRELPIADIAPMTAVVGASVAERRFTMLLLTAFAAVAVVLAVIGIYGVLAYLVGQRTQEIGVRLAIGATPGNVVALFVREGAALTLAGVACGIAGALAVTRALSTLLFGVTTTDPAARVDPMTALRND